ncbi:MAG: class F sortase [Caldilineaceae bacterium]
MFRFKYSLIFLFILLTFGAAGCQITPLGEAGRAPSVSSLRELAALATVQPPSPPERLKIPRLGVDAIIESIGLADDGSMGAPTYVEDVAWYNRGAIPGEIGKAVLAGHLDAIGGVPAVFYRIGSLQAGDSVIVVHADGGESHFEVTHTRVYPYAETPFEDIFGFTLQSELNLITCTGSWSRSTQNYTDRLVVFTRKVN